MKQTKITAKIYEPLLSSFNKQLSALHIKRDSFLNSMLRSEMKYLAKEMKGKKLTKKAKLHIADKLRHMDLETVSINVDKEVADELNQIVESSNLVRDAFINRLIMLLRSSDELLTTMDLPRVLTGSDFDSAEYMPCSPLKTIEEVMNDPLYYLRIASEKRYGVGLYECELPSKLIGFSCYIDDELVPGTIANKVQNEISEKLLNDLFNLESGFAEPSKESK